MRRSVKVAIATIIMGSSLTLTACDDGSKEPANTSSQEPKTEAQAQEEAQELLDDTVGNTP